MHVAVRGLDVEFGFCWSVAKVILPWELTYGRGYDLWRSFGKSCVIAAILTSNWHERFILWIYYSSNHHSSVARRAGVPSLGWVTCVTPLLLHALPDICSFTHFTRFLIREGVGGSSSSAYSLTHSLTSNPRQNRSWGAASL